MLSLKKIKCGWKWLDDTLNDMITAINQRTPQAGAGIDIDCYDGDFVIQKGVGQTNDRTTSPTSDSGGSIGSADRMAAFSDGQIADLHNWLLALDSLPYGASFGWQTIQVIDNSTGTCVTKTIYYFGTAPV